MDGTTTLGTGTLSSSGLTTYIAGNLSTGTHNITAVYGGDSYFNGSTSAAYSHTINPPAAGSTTVIVTSSVSPAVYGQPVTLTASVTGSGNSNTPGGNIAFLDGGVIIGSANLNGGSPNVSVLTTNALTIRSHAITAVYGGDSNFNGNTSAIMSQVVNKANTNATVSSIPNPATYGQSVTFTAAVNVQTPGSGTPTGTVTFMDGTTTLGTGTLSSSGLATYIAGNLSTGTHTNIAAVYGGDAYFNNSTSAAYSQTINTPPSGNTTITVTADVNPSTYGQLVTLTATVTRSGNTNTPSGSISFQDGSSLLGTGTLNGGSPNTATFSTSTLSVGSHYIAAVYGGDTNFGGSTSAVLTQTVGRTSQSIVFGPLVNKNYGDPAFIVNAATSSGLPVNFSISGPAYINGNLVTITGVGMVTVTASQSGSGIYSAASAVSQSFTVGKGTPNLNNLLSPIISAGTAPTTSLGGNITLGTLIPTGSVSITFNGATQSAGIGGGGAFSSSFSTVTIPAGFYPVTYSYGGDSNFNAVSDSSNMLTVTAATLQSIIVTPGNSQVTFVAGNPPAVQFNATAIYSDGSRLDVTSSAVWTTSSSSAAASTAVKGLVNAVTSGTTSITATYNLAGSSTLTILPDTVAPVVNLESPADGLALPDGSTQLTVSGSINGYAASAQVVVNGNPPVDLTLSPWAETRTFNQVVAIRPSGNNSIMVEAQDQASNLGTSAVRNVVINTNPIPVVTIISPSSGLITNSTSLAVQGIVTGSGAVTVRVNNTDYTPTLTNGLFTQTVNLAAGANIISASAYATNHNLDANFLGASGIKTVTLDQTAPVVTIGSPANGSYFGTPAITVSGTVDDPMVTAATLTLGSQTMTMPVTNGSFNQQINLSAGNNNIAVTATDQAGNTSAATAASSIAVTYDSSLPTVIINSPVNNFLTSGSTVSFSGTVYTASPSTPSLALLANGVQIEVASGRSINFANVALSPGANTFKVTATVDSKVGSSGSLIVNQDNTPPALTIGLGEPTDTVVINVTSNEALSGLPTVTVNGTGVNMTWTESLKWVGSYKITADGAYEVTATGSDIAGNSGSADKGHFNKQTVTIASNANTQIATASGTTVQFNNSSTGAVTGSVDVTQTAANPAGNNITGPNTPSAVYLNINASAALRNAMTNIVIKVPFDPAYYRTLGIDPATAKVYLWDVSQGKWVDQNSQSYPAATPPYIQATLLHLSQYGVFGSAIVNSHRWWRRWRRRFFSQLIFRWRPSICHSSDGQ